MPNDKDISFNPKWNMKRVKIATVARAGVWIDKVYNYNLINDQFLLIKQRRENSWAMWNNNQNEMTDLDPDVWDEIVNTLEPARQFVYDTCREFGVSEFESHFLSINWTINTIKKFRNKFFKAIADEKEFREYDRTQYDRTALKEAINILLTYFRLMAIDENYIWSKEAVNGHLSQFKKEASWDIARELAEDTSAILHTKLML